MIRVKVRKGYFSLTILLFVIEILIASYAHDEFIRPYFGDYLVVMLLYCAVRSISDLSVFRTALAVLLFSYMIEVLQYFNIVALIGLEQYAIARTVIGTSFAWTDLLAYTLGIITVIWLEYKAA